MNKLLIITIILAIFPIMQTFANEIENSPDVSIEENPQVTPKFSLDEKSIEAKTYKATRRTALGSIFLSYSGIWALGFVPLSVYLIMTVSTFGLMLTPAMIIPSIGFLIPGLIMLAGGLKYYREKRQNCDSKTLAKYYKSKIKNWERMSIATGIISGVGLTVGGIGAGMICGGIINTYNVVLFNSGIAFSTIGGIMLFSALPAMITSLAMSAWLKGQTNRLSVDIGVTSGNSGELSCDKKRNALEKPSGVALALSVKF
jgi:hypothetical protein